MDSNVRRGLVGIASLAAMTVAMVVVRQASRPPAPEAPATLSLADEATVRAFGERLEEQFLLPTPEDDLHGMVDLVQLTMRAAAEESGARRAEFFQGVEASASGQSGILEQLHRMVQDDGLIIFRGVAMRDGHPVARFLQMFGGESGVSFFDLLIAQSDDGPRVVDYFQLMNGRWQSEMVREWYIAGVVNAPSALQRAMGERNAVVDNVAQIQEIGAASRAGEFERVLGLVEALPEELQRSKLMMSMRMDAASRLPDRERYLAILDEYTQLAPDDPSVRVRLFDAHFQREQWDAALVDIESLRTLFPDPYWDSTEADVAMASGDHERALELAERTRRDDPWLLEASDTALLASLALGRTDRAIHHALTLRDRFTVDLEGLAQDPGYEGLAALPIPDAAIEVDAP